MNAIHPLSAANLKKWFHMSHDLGTVTIFRLLGLGLVFELGKRVRIKIKVRIGVRVRFRIIGLGLGL